MQLKTLLWLALAGLLAGGMLLLFPGILTPPTTGWHVIGDTAWIVGTEEDPYAYAGGSGIQSVDGDAQMQQEGASPSGAFHVTIETLPDALPSLAETPDGESTGPYALEIELLEVLEAWESVAVFGDSGNGDSRLPATDARVGGRALFRVTLQGSRQESEWHGTWCVADALRKEDGAIRKQGLVFSPLLRDRQGFSDPSRLELSLMLYADVEESDPPFLYLVFPDPDWALAGGT